MTYEQILTAVSRECPNEYAKAYARAGHGMTGREATTQLLYILSNLSHWRGERAREVKAAIKRLAL